MGEMEAGALFRTDLPPFLPHFFLFRTQLGLLSQKCWAILVEGCTGSATKCPDPHKGRNSWSVTVPAAGHPAYSQISSPWDIGTFDVSF